MLHKYRPPVLPHCDSMGTDLPRNLQGDPPPHKHQGGTCPQDFFSSSCTTLRLSLSLDIPCVLQSLTSLARGEDRRAAAWLQGSLAAKRQNKDCIVFTITPGLEGCYGYEVPRHLQGTDVLQPPRQAVTMHKMSCSAGLWGCSEPLAGER